MSIASERSEKLKQDLEGVEQHINSFFSIKPQPYQQAMPNLEDLSMDNLDSMIKYLRCQYDGKQGVNWYIDEEHQSLIRDASTQQQYNAKEVDAIAWTGQFVNSCRAALLYLDYAQPDINLQKPIRANIQNLLKQAIKDNNCHITSQKDLQSYNTSLINNIADSLAIVDNKAKKVMIDDLKKALDCVGLRDTHYHFTTISSPKNGHFTIETDIKLDGFTDNMKKQVAEIAEKGLYNDKGPKWYEKLNPYERFLSINCAKEFQKTDSNKVIPTQFLASGLLPGLRNCYMEIAYGKKPDSKMEELLRVYRSGTPTTDYKNDDKLNLELTKDAITAFTDTLGKTCLNPLITATSITPEKKFYDILHGAVSDDAALLSKGDTPLNIMRVFHPKRDFSGFNAILKTAETKLGKPTNLPPIQDAAMKNLTECRNRMENSLLNSRVPDFISDNNYQLSLKMAQAVHDLKRGPLKDLMGEAANDIPEMLSFCKSGKDRTGIRMRMGSDAAFKKYFGSDVHTYTVRAGHQQHLPGVNAGTPLCYGIKGEAPPAMPQLYRGKRLAIDSSNGNIFPNDGAKIESHTTKKSLPSGALEATTSNKELKMISKSKNLDERKADIKAHIETVLKGSSVAHDVTRPVRGSVLTMEYLDEMVDHFKWKYDTDLGVKWHVKGGSLIRDASAQGKYDAKAVEATAWTGQFVNSCRGALLYINYQHQTSGLDTADLNKKISALLDRALKGGNNLKEKSDLQLYNTTLINDIANALGTDDVTGKKKLKLDLEKSICCVGLRDKHYNISTITSLGEGNFAIESDIKIKSLTEKMQQEVGEVAGKKFTDNATGPKWFQKLDNDYDKFLSISSCGLFKDSGYEKVIPTQFLPFKLMPGLRNAYTEVTYGKKAGAHEIAELLQVFRSSNPIANYKDHDMNLDATKGSLEAFTENVSDKVCLNPLTNSFGIEKKFHKLIDEVIKGKSDYSKGETPVNFNRYRHLNRDFSGFKAIINMANKAVEIPTGHILSSAEKSALKNLDECKKRMGNSLISGRLPDSIGDNNYQLSLKMAQAVHDLKRGALRSLISDEVANDIPEIITFCKSGKDRTGIRMRLGSDAALADYFGYSPHERTISAGHQQHLCGAGGGVPLCYGVKAFGIGGETGSAMPLAYRSQGLGLKTADGNNFLHTENFEKDIRTTAAAQEVIPKQKPQQDHTHNQSQAEPGTTHKSVSSKGNDSIFMYSSLFIGLLFGGGMGLLLVAIILAMTMEKNKSPKILDVPQPNGHADMIKRQREHDKNTGIYPDRF